MVTCPICGETHEPFAEVGGVVVCGHCGVSLVVDAAGTVRRATAADIEGISDADVQTLRRARGAIVRPTKRQR